MTLTLLLNCVNDMHKTILFHQNPPPPYFAYISPNKLTAANDRAAQFLRQLVSYPFSSPALKSVTQS